LLPLLTGQLAGLIEDFGAAPVEIAIHGLRWLPSAVRVWGTVTVERGDNARSMDIEWPEAPVVKESTSGWRIIGRALIHDQR
jgi:hypothetical protein